MDLMTPMFWQKNGDDWVCQLLSQTLDGLNTSKETKELWAMAAVQLKARGAASLLDQHALAARQVLAHPISEDTGFVGWDP